MDDDTLDIIEEDARASHCDEVHLHPDLENAWQKIIREGLRKDRRAELVNKYRCADKSPLSTPICNDEVLEIVSDAIQKRDHYFTIDQDLCGATLSALGSAMGIIFENQGNEIDSKDLLRRLNDAGKLASELHNQLTKARKFYLYPSFKPKAKAVLKKSETGEYLFGPDLEKRWRAAQAFEKFGATVKQDVPAKRSVFKASAPLNWRGPPQGRNQLQADNQNSSSQYRNQRGSSFGNRRPYQRSNRQALAEKLSSNLKQ